VVLGAAINLVIRPTAFGAWILLGATLVKLGCELGVLKHGAEEIPSQLQRTARLQSGPLRPALAFRIVAGFCGGVLLPFVMIAGRGSLFIYCTAALLCMLGELAERYLFFASVAPDKMPGNIGS
jgi:hypothetical protein